MNKKNKPIVARRREYTASFYQGNLIAYAVAMLAALCTMAINLMFSWMIQQITDVAAGTPGTMTLPALTFWAVMSLVLIVAFAGITYLSKPRFMQKAMRQYKDKIFRKLTQKSIASFQQESTASYISALSNDAATIETGYVENQFELGQQLLMLVGALAMMLWYSPVMTAVACLFALLSVCASMFTGKPIEAAERRVSERNESFVAMLKDSLSGFSVLKSFKAEDAIARLFSEQNERAEQAKYKKRKLYTVVSMLGGVAGVTTQFGTLLVGVYLARAGMPITPGVLILFVDLTGSLIMPIRALPGLFAQRKAAAALIDKLADSLDRNVRDEGERIPGILQSGIELKNVSFGYDPDKPVLHELNLSFEAGKSYAVVGASGSGKSTLLNLLMAGQNSYTGEIQCDGRELRDISSESLYDIISMIQQNVFLFNASIRDNITMFHEFPKEAVEQAIQRSGLTEVLAARGEDCLCGENGSNLSGGEKQRISIARSLLCHPSVLLADEATAALDAQTAHSVSSAILDLTEITRIVVTHAMEGALLKRFDRILVFKNGHVVEQGTFDELMGRKDYFYSLYTVSQA